jgi:ParB family chromosome partitioning protein
VKELPFLLDELDAIDIYKNGGATTDAIKAYVVGYLSKKKYTNGMIREALGIDKVYTATHLIRAGTKLSDEELTLWHNNPTRITLGHIRAIASMDRPRREKILRDHLVVRKSVRDFTALANGKTPGDLDPDIKRYQEGMTVALGAEVTIEYNPNKHSGSVTIDFHSLEAFDGLAKTLGYAPDEF